MRQVRRYVCDDGHEIIWDGDTEPKRIAGIRFQMAYPDTMGCLHQISYFPTKMCGAKVRLERIESPYERSTEGTEL